MNKKTLFLGIAGGFLVLTFIGPDRIMQVSVTSMLDDETPPVLEMADEYKDVLDAFESDEVGTEVDAEAEEEVENGVVTDELIEEEKSAPEIYFKSYMTQEKFFEKAYREIENDEPFSDKAYAGILPHHLIHSSYIAEYFERLAGTQHIDTFFVIGPNHFDRGKKAVAVSKYGYGTPYGDLEPDSYIIDGLLDSDYLGWDMNAFDEEHSISSLVPFIKKNFPDAEIVPIVLKIGVSNSSLDKLVDDLVDAVGPNDFVLGSIDFSHYMWNNVADFHDELSQTVIETYDYDQIYELEIDSRPTLYTLMKYTEAIGAQHVDVINHSNSASKVNGEDFVKETTSHFYIAFEEGEPSAARNFTMLAVGDLMMGRYVRTLMENSDDKEYAFQKIRGTEDRFLYGQDVFFGNLEGPIEGEGYKSGTSLIFGFHEDTAPLLKRMGFDVLSIANNHILNQGWDGFESTVNLLRENDIGACGHPTEANPYSVVYREFGGKKVAFLCFDDIDSRLDIDTAVSLVSDVDKKVDFVVVSIHWGVEYVHTPNNSKQVVPARKFVDAGADAIIGHHPHVVQTMEIYNGVPIFYSLGNFIFDQYWSYDTEEMLGVGLVMGDDFTRAYLFPMHSDRSQPYLMDYEEKQRFYDRFLKWGQYEDDLSAQIRDGVVEILK